MKKLILLLYALSISILIQASIGNNSISFDGINDYCTANLATTVTNNVTLEAWVNWRGSNSNYQVIVSNGNPSSSGYDIYIDHVTNTIGILCGGISWVPSSVILPTSTWVHVAAVRSSGVWHMYINGNEITLTNNSAAPNTPTGKLFIGSVDQYGYNFNGSIDEVRIWNIARTQSDIILAMRSPILNASSVANLVTYYSFNQGIANADNTAITTLTDLSASGNNATLTNLALTGTTSNWVTGFNASGTYQLSQAQNSASFSANGGSVNDTINSNVSWTASSDQSWLKVGSSTAAGNAINMFTATYNPFYAPRTATVTLSASGVSSQTFTITQEAAMNNALSFDGINDKVSATLATTVTDNVTLEAWVNWNGLTSDEVGQIILLNGSSTSSGYSLYLNQWSGDVGSIGVMCGGNAVALTSQTLTIGTWTHLAAVRDNGIWKIYINGIPQDVANNSVGPNIPTTGTFVGVADNNAMHFNGSIDEVRIWNIARNQSQIISAMTSPIVNPNSVANLVAYYGFNEGEANADNTGITTLPDNSALTHNGTLSNFDLTGTSSNWISGFDTTALAQTIVLSASTENFDSTSSNQTSVRVYTLANWTATSNNSWLHVSPSIGTGYSSVTLTADGNSNDIQRTGTVTITASGLPEYFITVIQSGITTFSVVSTGGHLGTQLSSIIKSTCTKLTVTGSIDASDFNTMRDNMPNLAILDLSGATMINYIVTMGPPIPGPMPGMFMPGPPISTPVPTGQFPASAFNGKSSLTSVIYPKYVTSIGPSAFQGCSGLSTLNIPSSVSFIGSNAFDGCSGITSILANSHTPVDFSSSSNVFNGVDKVSCILYVPYGSADRYLVANQWGDFAQIDEFGIWNGTGNITDTSKWSNNFIPPYGSNILVQSGALNINQNDSLGNVTIASNAKVTLQAEVVFKITGNLLIQSSDTTTGSFVDKGGIISVYGSSIVQQFIPSGRNYYISSPVVSAHGSVVKTQLTNTLWDFDEENSTWNEILDTSITLSVMKGYVANISSDDTLRFHGTFNTGFQTINVSLLGSGSLRGFNLIGNPYPSAVNWNMAEINNIESSIWYRTKNKSNAYVFDTYNANSGIGTNNNEKAEVSGIIPPLQAVWVRVDTTKTSGDIAFTNVMRCHQGDGNYLKSDVSPVNIRLKISNGKNTDETIIAFNANASNGIDKYDSRKMFNNNSSIAEIYSTVNAEKLTINGMKSIDSTKHISIGYKTAKSGIYTITANEINGIDGIVVLEDKLLKKSQDLSKNPTYSFTSDSVENTARFVIHLKSGAETTATTIEPESKINIYSVGNTAVVSTSVENANGTVTVFDILGQTIASAKITGTKTDIELPAVAAAYFVKVETVKVVETKKIVVE